jgi:hypothetical protein
MNNEASNTVFQNIRLGISLEPPIKKLGKEYLFHFCLFKRTKQEKRKLVRKILNMHMPSNSKILFVVVNATSLLFDIILAPEMTFGYSF